MKICIYKSRNFFFFCWIQVHDNVQRGGCTYNARYVQTPLARSFRFPRSSPSMFQVISEKVLSSSFCGEFSLLTPALLVVASAVRSMLKRECICLLTWVILICLTYLPKHGLISTSFRSTVTKTYRPQSYRAPVHRWTNWFFLLLIKAR